MKQTDTKQRKANHCLKMSLRKGTVENYAKVKSLDDCKGRTGRFSQHTHKAKVNFIVVSVYSEMRRCGSS